MFSECFMLIYKILVIHIHISMSYSKIDSDDYQCTLGTRKKVSLMPPAHRAVQKANTVQSNIFYRKK